MKKLTTRLLLTILFSLWSSIAIFAVNANPEPITVRQSDGSYITVIKRGNEFFNYTTTVDGYIIAQKAGIYYFASYSPNGKINFTSVKANDKSQTLLGFGKTKSLPTNINQILAADDSRMSLSKRSSSQKFPNEGKIKSLVILAEFSDKDFIPGHTSNEFYNLLNQENYSVNGGTGSVRDYYYQNSDSKFDPEFVVVGPVKLDKSMEYYGGNNEYGSDKNPQQLIVDACKKANEDLGVDFSQYDYNSDGYVDNVFVYYSGYNEAEGGPAESIWPHRYFVQGGIYFDGVQLGDYACTSELSLGQGEKMASIGTFCHEFGHVLGLVDLYDTDGMKDGYGDGVYNWSIMCTGNYNNESRTPPFLSALELDMIGWLKPTVITNSGDFQLNHISNGEAFILNSNNDGEYFILENRQKEGWDKYLGGHGLLIYHVDKSNNIVGNMPAYARWDLNSPNNVAAHPCMKIVAAKNNMIAGKPDHSMIPFPGAANVTNFSKSTNPSTVLWGKDFLSQSLRNIKEENGVIKFTVAAESKKAKLSGAIFENDGHTKIASAKIKLSKKEKEMKSHGISFLSTTTSEYSVISDIDGNFMFPNEFALGEYILEVSKDGYDACVKNISLIPGDNIFNVKMSKEEENKYKELKYHTERYSSAIGVSGSPFKAAVQWNADDLSLYAGHKLSQVKVFIKDEAEVSLLVYFGDSKVPALEKPFTPIIGTWTTIDLSKDNISIPAGKQMRIAYSVISYPRTSFPASVDQGPSVDGKSNLIYINDSWQTLSSAANKSSNWLISAYVLPSTAIPVTGISLSNTEMDILVGEEKQIESTIFPSTATNKFVKWTSSNEDLLSVDKYGKIRGLGAGDVNVTATTEDGGFSATCKVKVILNQQVSGLIVNTANEPLEGVNVKYSNGSNDFSALTDAKGEFIIKDLPNGKYAVTLSKNEYTTSTLEDEIISGLNDFKAIMETEAESAAIKLQYYSGEYESTVGLQGQEMIAAILYDQEDLADYVGYQVSQVRFLLMDKASTEVQIFMGNSYADDLMPKFKKEVTPKIGEFTIVDLSDDEVYITPDSRMRVGYKMSLYKSSTLPATLDGTPAANGKGNLMMLTSEYKWMSVLDESSIDGNWMISVYLTRGKNMIPVESVSILEKTINVAARETKQIIAKVLPENATNKGIKWSSSNEEVAIINSKGEVTGISKGEVTITALTRDGGKEATCQVIVSDPKLASVKGKVVSEKGEPIENAKIIFEDQNPIDQPEKTGTQQYRTLAKAPVSSTTIFTDKNGEYFIPEMYLSNYKLLVQAEDFQDYTTKVKIVEGENTIDNITLKQDSRVGGIKLRYHDGNLVNAIGGGGASFIAACLWPAEDLLDYQGYHLKYVDITLYSEAKVQVLVHVGDSKTPVFSEEMYLDEGANNIDISEKNIFIPAHEQLFVGYKLLEYNKEEKPAAVDGSQTLKSNGSLMFAGGKWGHISDVVENFKGNWMITAYLYEAERILVDKIELSSDNEGNELVVGDTLRVVAKVKPENATNKKLLWTSSDESIAEVDQNGVIVGIAEGHVIIKVKSEDGNASAQMELNVMKKQLLRGLITDHNNTPVEDVNVKITSVSKQYVEEQFGAVGVKRLLKDLRSDTWETLSEEDGKYRILNVPSGQCTIELTKAGYRTQQSTINISEGVTVKDFTFISNEIAESKNLQWHNGVYGSSIGAGGPKFIAAAEWSAEDLSKFNGQKLIEAKIFLQEEAKADLVIFAGDNNTPILRMPIKNPKIGDFTTIDLREKDIFINADSFLRVGYELLSYNGYPAAVDASDAIEAKGNVIGMEGQWTTLTEVGNGKLKGNWLISVTCAPSSDFRVDVVPGQIDAIFSIFNSKATEWEVEWRLAGSKEALGKMKTTNLENMIKGLSADKSYEIIVSEVDGVSFTRKFSTSKITSTYPRINIAYEQLKDVNIYPQVFNLPDDSVNVRWLLDGEIVKTLSITPAVGEHLLEVEITSEKGVEVISKYINIK